MKQTSQAQKFVWIQNIPNEVSPFFILLLGMLFTMYDLCLTGQPGAHAMMLWLFVFVCVYLCLFVFECRLPSAFFLLDRCTIILYVYLELHT